MQTPTEKPDTGLGGGPIVHYPIELDLPDIRPYAEGNCGIPYVFTFDSGVPGPHVLVNAITHGNECDVSTLFRTKNQTAFWICSKTSGAR